MISRRVLYHIATTADYNYKAYFFILIATTQLKSMLTSFLSLSMSSVKIFYSQRLGKYMTLDPTLRMILFATPVVMIFLPFPLFSLILTAAYLRSFVLVHISLIMLLNLAVLKLPSLTKHLYIDLKYLYRNNLDQGKKDANSLLIIALYTSWMSPFTVWYNYKKFKSYFLPVSSLATLLGHFLAIVVTYIFATYGDVSFTRPPVTHCFLDGERLPKG